MVSRTYYVYILKAEKYYYNRRFKEFVYDKIIYYTGMTWDPKRRLAEHRSGIRSNYMRNKINPLHFVYMESFDNPYTAHQREMQIKRLSLNKKLKLIEEYNES
ncbi:MAG: GIY-YIG nuclease family protein [Candidatus Heimdallarchaeaceae archaeon]